MVKPNGMILSYPVITSGEFAHTGSFECLIGEDYNDLDKRKEQSLEFQVSKDTPIVVNCFVGLRAYLAIMILKSYGYTNLYNLSGGYRTYSANNYKLNS